MYKTSSTNYLLSDGRRELTSAMFSQLAPASYSACASCPCIFLDSNFETRNAPCNELRSFLCEFKGQLLLWDKANNTRSHGLVVKADGSRSRGRGFEPRHRILDGCWLLIVFTQHNPPATIEWRVMHSRFVLEVKFNFG